MNSSDAPTEPDPVFGIHVVTAVPEVPGEILKPRDSWEDVGSYDAAAQKLAGLFIENFKTYEDDCPPEVRGAGPKG